MVAGFYFDPRHGGCLRRIVKVGADAYKIYGVYGSDEGVQVARNVEYDPEPSELTHNFWHASLRVQKKTEHLQHLAVDFTGKAGKKRLQYTAIYDAKKRTIDWDDTNTWKQLYYHDKQLLRSPHPSVVRPR